MLPVSRMDIVLQGISALLFLSCLTPFIYPCIEATLAQIELNRVWPHLFIERLKIKSFTEPINILERYIKMRIIYFDKCRIAMIVLVNEN